ncbi:MAG: beta-mannosidase [Armatimonadetes bacterium]|nr:beta-mannosidase [Armatimonadota bacterium]NCP33688.1 beta-mannosidase [Armatimonadota bacterium]
MNELLLNGTWELRDEPLGCPLSEAGRLATSAEGWIPQPVPGDIHQGLIEAGRIKEPLLGLHSFDCRWTEQRSWWFRRTFEAPPEWGTAEVVELELNGLDANAEVFLNGAHLGSHPNAFRPFVLDVKRWLQAGENVLLVRLTAGVETVTEADLDAPDGVRGSTEAGNGRPERGDQRRTLVRKPQYSFGWDWSPRVATTCIAGDVKLRAMREACIRQVALRPVRVAAPAEGVESGRSDGSVRSVHEVAVAATVTVDRFHYYKTANGTVSVKLTDTRGRQTCAQADVLLRSGLNFVELRLTLDDPQLWWPNGLGEQHRYRVESELTVGDERSSVEPFDWGLRFVGLDTDDKFAFVVNGRKVFAKGANWIPADTLYARVTDDRYHTLVREAREANFNMLRIWGGGLYEREAFYQACDRYGIMVWHDFMFSCAPYPDHLDSFCVEVEREADYQTKRLQRHACIALWCGSNENNWGFRDWWREQTKGGAHAYNYLLPAAVQRNCPEVPYWNGSPYGGEAPNCEEVGDRHHWFDCMMNPDMEQRITPEEYDKCNSLFVSEFGYIGAPPKESVLAYLDADPDRGGQIWQHHNNTFEKNTVEAGIRKHYADPENLSLDEYLLYSGLCQGLMYGHALDSMRCRPNCHGSLFWMYEDCWGEVGWTIVDYYLRRKPSWYFVRRAYAPVRIVLRCGGDHVRVIIANDTQEDVSFRLESGYVGLAGLPAALQESEVTVPALSREQVATFAYGDHDACSGLWIARAADRDDIPAGILRAVDYRQLKTADPELSFSVAQPQDGHCTVEVGACGYAHAVHLLLPPGCLPADDYFDLLPGESRRVRVASAEVLDAAAIGVTCANAG